MNAAAEYLRFMYGKGDKEPPNVIRDPNIAEAISLLYYHVIRLEKSRTAAKH